MLTQNQKHSLKLSYSFLYIKSVVLFCFGKKTVVILSTQLLKLLLILFYRDYMSGRLRI